MDRRAFAAAALATALAPAGVFAKKPDDWVPPGHRTDPGTDPGDGPSDGDNGGDGGSGGSGGSGGDVTIIVQPGDPVVVTPPPTKHRKRRKHRRRARTHAEACVGNPDGHFAHKWC